MRTPVLANKPTILIFVYCYGTSTASPICKMGREKQREHDTKGICWHIVFGTLRTTTLHPQSTCSGVKKQARAHASVKVQQNENFVRGPFDGKSRQCRRW
jgi:hypothetical protein